MTAVNKRPLGDAHSATVLMSVETQVALLHHKLGLDEGGHDGD